MKAEGFVLAGGGSRRMGSPKALALFRGKSLLERAVETLRSLEVPVSLALAPGQTLQAGGCPVVFDHVPNAGPLGGILTALSAASSDTCLILACDLPLTGPELFARLLALQLGHDAVAPVDGNGQVHPLCAVYTTGCLPEIQRRVKEKELSVEAFLASPRIRARLVSPSEHGLPDWRFHNVNTPADLELLSRLPGPSRD